VVIVPVPVVGDVVASPSFSLRAAEAEAIDALSPIVVSAVAVAFDSDPFAVVVVAVAFEAFVLAGPPARTPATDPCITSNPTTNTGRNDRFIDSAPPRFRHRSRLVRPPETDSLRASLHSDSAHVIF